jgi:hypothetical protein
MTHDTPLFSREPRSGKRDDSSTVLVVVVVGPHL